MKAEDGAKLILASRSPRRRQLLAASGRSFRVVAPDEAAECGVCSRETPAEKVARLATQKARDVALRPELDDVVVLACDTLVECRGSILGKPRDRRHARSMLRQLRGRIHAVYSGVCLWRRPDDHRMIDVAVSRLRMEDVGDELIERYLDTDQWEGKAGAFGYQDDHDWLCLLEGSESNVVGLPMELVDTMLDAMTRTPTTDGEDGDASFHSG